MNLTLKINKNKPTDISSWNEVCQISGNFNQSTYFDSIQAFFSEIPIYFEVSLNNVLIGGVKFFLKSPNRNFFSYFNKSLIQFGEVIYAEENQVPFIKEIILKELYEFIDKEKITKYTTCNYYYSKEFLIKLDNVKPTIVNEFNFARINLESNQDLFKSYNRNTRRNINKANESGLIYESNHEIGSFNKILKKVYEQQNNMEGCPNLDFVSKAFNISGEHIGLYFCHHNKEELSAVLTANYGGICYSWFGGTVKNDFGSGQKMYYELMLEMQQKGYKWFYFGQIAKEGDTENEKFSKGISTFKRGFNCEEIEAEKVVYILAPIRNKIWNLLVNLRKRIK